MRLTLRVKLALISLLLLTIPLAGIRVSQFIKQEQLISREDSLLFSAKAVSSALSGRPTLFDKELFHSQTINSDLYLHPLSNHIRLNGKIDDWKSQIGEAQTFGADHIVYAKEDYNTDSLSFKHVAGVRGKFLYTLFLVKDDNIVYRSPNSLSLDKSDYLQIGIEDMEGKEHRYLLTASKPGWVNGFTVLADTPGQVSPELRIQGMWEETTDGYVLELRLPMELVGPKLAFSIGDVDDPKRRSIKYIISTTTKDNQHDLGSLVTPSTTIENIIKPLSRPHSRIQIVDGNRRLRASHGTLSQPEEVETKDAELLSRISSLSFRIFSPMYQFFMTPFATDVEPTIKQLATLDLAGVDEALKGTPTVTHYRIEKDKEQGVEVMAAIAPLYKDDLVVGAVVVEQTTNSILALQNKIIEEFITLTILLFFVAGFSIILFAFRLSSRIRRLGKQAAEAIDSSGQLHSTIPKSVASDEIGDLSRTLTSMLGQIKIQTEFREKMADNLEHEIRTPLAGISASLKNLSKELDNPDAHIQEYLDWAVEDVARLEALLSTIRDATNLQQALTHDEKEDFDLNKAIEMWLEHSWQPAFPNVTFTYEGPELTIPFIGDPGRLHQMLDKLVENAVTFHTKDTPILLSLQQQTGSQVVLSVTNEGPTIPDELRPQIFNSMVSSRSQSDNQPHLGLGLYIAREITKQYGGTIQAVSSIAPVGTKFIITLNGPID